MTSMHSGATESSRPSIRIGGVSYLNSKPLLWRLEEEATRRGLAISLQTDVPSRLAHKLTTGDLDVGLISSIEYFRATNVEIVSDACIASLGPVRSVKVLGRVPPEEVRSLALDAGSRSSVVLARILFSELLGSVPATEPFPLGATLEEVRADAVLLIGDRAMRPPRERFAFEWDLGEKWQQLTGLPFVFALWIAVSGAPTSELAALFQAVRDAGLAHLEEIALAEAGPLGFDPEFCLRYFKEHLHFTMKAPERAGLEEFQTLAKKHGLL